MEETGNNFEGSFDLVLVEEWREQPQIRVEDQKWKVEAYYNGVV